MPANRSFRKTFMVSIPTLVFIAWAAFAAQQTGAAGGQDKSVTLAYQFPEGKTVAYRNVSTETQAMEIMGQTMGVSNLSTREFLVKPKGMKEEHLSLGVTIDGFKLSIDSPQGAMSADASSLLGKSFDMVLSSLGKEIDTSGASSLQYDLGAGGRRNIAAGFQAFFPDLPDHPVKTGDTWLGRRSV